MLTVADAAKELGLKEATIRAWIARRQLAYVKLGRSVRVPAEEITRLIKQGTVPAVAEQ